MQYVIAGHTDIGPVKRENQDAYCFKVAKSSLGPMALAAVADGMGGLSGGELASALAIRHLACWFDERFPQIMAASGGRRDAFELSLNNEWRGLVADINQRIGRFGASQGIRLGTTLSVLLLIGSAAYTLHVGDSRIYCISREGPIKRMTEDQTFVMREVKEGRLTPEEAEVHPDRNVLLQCVGASRKVDPALGCFSVKTSDCFLLCSDGFYRELADSDLAELQACCVLETSEACEAAARRALAMLCDRAQKKGEEDNVTAVMLAMREEVAGA